MTAGDCRKSVDRLLDARPLVITRQEHLDARRRVVEQLALLIPDCTAALEQRARELLAMFDPPAADALSMILEALAERGECGPVVALATAALTAPGVGEREPFVYLLEDLGGIEAAQALAETLPLYNRAGDPDGFLRRRILRALTVLGGEHVPAIETALNANDSGRVREQAIISLQQLDARAAAPSLVRRLDEDDDPAVVARAASLLADWCYGEATTSLEVLAGTDWVREDDELRAAVENALERLS